MKLNLYLFIKALLLLVLGSQCTFASDNRLELDCQARVWGGSCNSGPFRILAGSCIRLTIYNSADQPSSPIIPGWPEGYVLEVMRDPNPGRPFAPDKDLLNTISRVRFVSNINRGEEHSLLSHDAPPKLKYLNSKEFVLCAPSELAGHSIMFRARYDKDGIHAVSNSTPVISVFSPCDKSDSASIVASRIFIAFVSDNYAQAIEIEDSLLAQDLYDASGLYYARCSAAAIFQFDKELLYLDRLYEKFGITHLPEEVNSPPKLNPDGIRLPEQVASFNYLKDSLRRQKARYEEQHQR